MPPAYATTKLVGLAQAISSEPTSFYTPTWHPNVGSGVPRGHGAHSSLSRELGHTLCYAMLQESCLEKLGFLYVFSFIVFLGRLTLPTFWTKPISEMAQAWMENLSFCFKSPDMRLRNGHHLSCVRLSSNHKIRADIIVM